MKKIYNQFTKSDIPLDGSLNSTTVSPIKNVKNSSSKPKIKAIGKVNLNRRSQNVENKKEDEIKISNLSTTDLDKINEENLKSYSFRAKRNRIIIIILIILLLISVVTFSVYFSLLDLSSNCYVYVTGNSNVTCYIDGMKITKFRSPAGLKGNRILEFDTNIKFNEVGNYNVSYYVVCHQGLDEISNILILEENEHFALNTSSGNYEGQITIERSGQIVDILEGVVIDREYEKTLNVNNFKLELFINIIKFT